MTEFREGLRDLSRRAAERHEPLSEEWTEQTLARGLRARRVRGVVGLGVAAALVAGIAVAGTALADRPAPIPPAPPAPRQTTPAPDPTTAAAGWRDSGADPAVFGDAVVSDAVSLDGRVVAVGCDPTAATGEPNPAPPIWVGDRTGAWHRASTDVPSVTCLHQVVSTPYGLFAAGAPGRNDESQGPWLRSANGGAVLRSDDGETWTGVVLDDGAGGVFVNVLAVIAAGDRVVAITTRGSLDTGASTAAIWVTADGDTWMRVGDGSTFHDAEIADVESVDGTLVAVGGVGWELTTQMERPGAAWTSQDGLTWRPATVQDSMGCYLSDVSPSADGLLLAGWCLDGPALWTSADGSQWVRAAAPEPDMTGRVVVVRSVTVLGDTVAIAASSVRFTEESWQWIGTPDGGWQRADELPLPYVIVDGVGFWPRVGGAAPQEVLVQD